MKKKEHGPVTPHELRHRAEKSLRERPPKTDSGQAQPDAQRLLHELQVHQVELELQNAELRQTRDELESTLENFTDLYDFAPVGYFTLSAGGEIQQVNLTGASLVGIERARLVGQCFGMLIATELRPAFRSFLKEVFSSPNRQTAHFEMPVNNVSRSVKIEARRSSDGRECRAVMSDVTEWKQAEDKTRISEVRYRRLFEAAHDGVLLLDPATRKITDANPFMSKLLGFPQEQLIGKELFEIGLLKDEASSQQMFRDLKKDRQVRYEDLPLKNKAGGLQDVEVVANLYQENGHTVIQCNIRDITERKQAGERLRRSQTLFASLIQQAPVGVYFVDAKFRLQQVNPIALEVFKNICPMIGRNLFEIMRILWPKRVADSVAKSFRQTLKTGEPCYSPEFAEKRLDTGAQDVYEWQLQRVTLLDGDYGVVCFFTNITQRKRAESTQRRLDVVTASNTKLNLEIVRRQAVERALLKSERHQRHLLAESRELHGQLRHLSHQILQAQEEERKRISRELHDEIVQTLTGINVRLVALQVDARSGTKNLRRKITSTQRLVEKSVEVVHRFARELRPSVLDDLGLIPALHSYVKLFAERTHLNVRLKVFAEVETLDGAKQTVLYRVSQEALTNVARHARATEVEICIEKLSNAVQMTITDDGRSFLVKRSQSRHSERLGLVGMRERVEMVGGRFQIHSSPGQGTTVEVQIPFKGRFRSEAAVDVEPS